MFSRGTTVDLAEFVVIVVVVMALAPRIAPKWGSRVSLGVWLLVMVVVMTMSVWNLLEVHP